MTTPHIAITYIQNFSGNSILFHVVFYRLKQINLKKSFFEGTKFLTSITTHSRSGYVPNLVNSVDILAVSVRHVKQRIEVVRFRPVQPSVQPLRTTESQ